MKKKLLVLSVIGLVSLSIVLLRENIMLKSKINVDTDNVEKIKHKDMLSLMLETEAGSGKYEMFTRDSWPTEGYTFNSILSKCENGGELSWDDDNKRVLMSGNLSDKCYVYFDKIMTLSEFVIAQYNGVQGNNNIYYHNSTLENGAGDNSYRYAGASDTTNNYVCFGSDAETCPEDNLYRIIGVFDGQVKLIKAVSLGTKAWNSGTKNTWSISSLNAYLNGDYLNGLDELSNKISFTIWKVGGNTSDNISKVTPSVAYQNELISPAENTTYNAKIGLIYVSDYGFTVLSDYWTNSINSYNSPSQSWLYVLNQRLWTITRMSDDSSQVFSVGPSLYMCKYCDLKEPYNVHPSFYLNSNVTYVSGDGTKDAPIRIN